jgi:uncharacterized membrane protein (UPF0127 family)
MRKAKVLRSGGGEFLGDCRITESAWERMRGLLPKNSLGEGEALYIAPCNSIHTFFMRFSIDAAFLDREGKVIALYEEVKPWRMTGIHFRAAGVLEAAAGAFQRAGVKKGEVLKICHFS